MTIGTAISVSAPTNMIVLKDEKRDQRFAFPVNPPRIQIVDGRQFQEVPVVGLGVALLAGPVNPQEIAFEGFFPREYDSSFCNYVSLEVPEDSVDRLLFWMGRTTTNIQQEATPLRVTVTGTQFSQLMVITDFQHSFEGGEPDAIYYAITLRQWRQQRVRVEEANAGGTTGTVDNRDEPPLTGESYTVVKGDYLRKLALRFYGSGDKWPTIYEANKAIIGSNPDLIYPGQVLVIP